MKGFLYPHATFRLEKDQHAKLRAIATENKVGLNELVRYVFGKFIAQYEDGEINLGSAKQKRKIEVVTLVY